MYIIVLWCQNSLEAFKNKAFFVTKYLVLAIYQFFFFFFFFLGGGGGGV